MGYKLVHFVFVFNCYPVTMFNSIFGAGADGAGAASQLRLRTNDAAPCGSGSATLVNEIVACFF
jgi:hypothetical protein